MRAVILGPDERSAIARVAAFAEQKENVYVPGPGAKVPGDDPRHTVTISGVRIVYSITIGNERPFRHISFSLTDRDDAMPHPIVVQEIAHLFGFTGPLESWLVDRDYKTNAIVLAQELPVG